MTTQSNPYRQAVTTSSSKSPTECALDIIIVYVFVVVFEAPTVKCRVSVFGSRLTKFLAAAKQSNRPVAVRKSYVRLPHYTVKNSRPGIE